MLRLAKTVRDIKLSKSKKEKGGLSNESKEVEFGGRTKHLIMIIIHIK